MRKKSYSENSTRLPANVEAEQAVVGAIINNRRSLQEASSLLVADDFWAKETGAIYDCCIYLYDKKKPVNTKTILSELVDRGFDKEVYEECLDTCVESSDTVLFSSNVSTIINFSSVRKIVKLGNKMAKDGMSPNPDANSMMQEYRIKLNAINNHIESIGPRIVDMVILTSNPRKYQLIFSDGRKVNIGLDVILSPQKIKQAIMNVLDFVPALPKDWEKFINSLMANAEKVQSQDANVDNDIFDLIRDLFSLKGEAKDASDLKSGAYIKDTIDGEKYYLFTTKPIIREAKRLLNKEINIAELWQLIYSRGGINSKNGKPISKRIGTSSRTGLWGLPAGIIEQNWTAKEEIDETATQGKLEFNKNSRQDHPEIVDAISDEEEEFLKKYG